MGLLRCMAIVAAAASAAGAEAFDVTTESLLGEMTDLSRLARFPDPPYAALQASSYDRRATDPSERNDENWFANGDRGQVLREETRNGETEYVLMDAEGPGAVTHFWSANPDDAGAVRIYLDGAETPVIDLPLSTFLSGTMDIAPAPIAGETARGWNSYLPIPYAQHCKVTTTQRDFYYIINHRRYTAGTRVQSFTREAATAQQRRIRSTAHSLRSPGGVVTPGSAQTTQTVFNTNVAPGGRQAEIAHLAGPGAIFALAGRIECPDPEAALRACLLEITFDDAEIPQVCAPLSDFFGSGLGLNPYSALPSGVPAAEIVYSKWVMPYAESAQLRLINHSDQGVITSFTVASGPWDFDERSLYFHAKWRGEDRIPTQPRQDWNILDAVGRGRYVGTVLHITNPTLSWWGEGDEKIYVDGAAFPSWFGTGTEDYFGYAWGNADLFSHAYHAQPRVDGPQNFGHTVNSRFHVVDDIPFEESLRFDIEVWHWADCTIAQSTMAYWYARPGGRDSFATPLPADLQVPDVALPDLKRVDGALEGEDFKVVAITGGMHEVQFSDIWGWSGMQHRWWHDAAPGDTMTLAFPVADAGQYEVRGVFTTANDYGIVQIAINGSESGDAIDFYHPTVQPTDEISLGTHRLEEGDNTLMATITGANEAAIQRYMFGVDYLRLVPVKE